MCFEIKTNRKLTAKKDIVCYKMLNRDMTSFYRIIFMKDNSFTGKYIIDKLYCEKDRTDIFTCNSSIYHITIGFNSCRTKKRANLMLYNRLARSEGIIVKGIIPKGACYYVNDEEYVSD